MMRLGRQIFIGGGLLILLMILAPSALAATGTGDFTVTGGTLGRDYEYNLEVLTVKTGTSLTIFNDDPGVSTTDRIFIEANVNANITLAGVNIDVSRIDDAPALQIADNSQGNVAITLASGTKNRLCSGLKFAGLQKSGNVGTLVIRGTGALYCQGGYGAGIGGGDERAGCGITIESGDIELKSTQGAGIGGGRNGNGQGIRIRGGKVTATMTGDSAGIGGGTALSCNALQGNGIDIEISGGEVTVVCAPNKRGSAIGGGFCGAGKNIVISGGKVKVAGTNVEYPTYTIDRNGIGGGKGGASEGNLIRASLGSQATVKAGMDANGAAPLPQNPLTGTLNITNFKCPYWEIEFKNVPLPKVTIQFYAMVGPEKWAVVKTENVNPGEDATPPLAEELYAPEGMKFAGWEGDYKNAQYDRTITAKYEPEKKYHAVKFVDHDGTVLKEEKVEQGRDATPPADPVREGYAFTGWAGDYKNVQADVTIKAQYEKKPEPAKKALRICVEDQPYEVLELAATNARTLTAYDAEGNKVKVTWRCAGKSVTTKEKSESRYKVKADRPGTATITATAADGRYGEVTVQVKKPTQAVTGGKLNKKERTLKAGEQYQLKASLQPKSAQNKKLIWLSTNEKIATVDQNGKVTAVSAGRVAIKAWTATGLKLKCMVTVK